MSPTIDTEILDAFLEKVPDEFKPIAVEYAPFILNLGMEEVLAWIKLILTDWEAAYTQVVNVMESHDAQAEWKKRIAAMAKLNIETSAQRKVFKEAGAALLLIILRLVLIAVSL